MLEVFQFYLTTSKSITTKDALDSALYPFFFIFFFPTEALPWTPAGVEPFLLCSQQCTGGHCLCTHSCTLTPSE